MKQYEKHGNLFFPVGTDANVIRVLNDCYDQKTRVRLHYGDAKTGRLWLEEHEVIGRVGRSTGDIRVPLLIKSSRSYGGGEILAGSIIGIQEVKTRRWLYRADNFQNPELEIHGDSNNLNYPFAVHRVGEGVQANFKTHKQAASYVAFMHGARMRVH